MSTIDTTGGNGAATALVVYDQITDPAAFIDKLGDAIFKSGMFGCESAPQGRVLALECAARKAPPLMLAERYHLIKGKLSMKADAMLGDFIAKAGGRHRIVERSESRAAIELTRGGQSQAFELTWEQAQQEPFVYAGMESAVCEKLAAGGNKGLKLKAKYATPRGRMQMLWARVVSDGVRAMAPEIVAGCYTPEEISDFDYVQVGRSSSGKAAAAKPEEAADAIEVDATPVSDPSAWDGIVEPNSTPAGGQPGPATPTIPADSMDAAEAAAQANGGMTTKALVTDQDVASATHAQVVAQVQQAQQQAQQADAQPSPLQPQALVGQATAHQVETVVSLVKELGVSRERLVAILKRVNASKVSEMSAAHCQALIGVLENEKAKRAAGGNGKN